MNPRIRLLSSILPLALLTGCPPLPPELVACEEADACDTTGPTFTSGDETPTTSDGVQTVTGDSADASSGSTAPADETGDQTDSTADQPVLPPQIVNGVVIPDYIEENGLLSVEVTTQNADGVQMLRDNGDLIELTPIGPGQFTGTIPAFTAIDNGKHKIVLTPSRDMLIGESVDADYVIALPPLRYEIGWQIGGLNGSVGTGGEENALGQSGSGPGAAGAAIQRLEAVTTGRASKRPAGTAAGAAAPGAENRRGPLRRHCGGHAALAGNAGAERYTPPPI